MSGSLQSAAYQQTYQQCLVVDVGYFAPINALAFILLQLPLEYMLIEEVLKLLVGQIDAHLLKAVDFKILKPKYIQNPC